jgi:hypothetical protein
MDLKLPNPEKLPLHDQLGLDIKRVEELCKAMDEKFLKGPPRILAAGIAYQEIAEMCTDLQEYTFAVSTHDNIMQNRQIHAEALPYTVAKAIIRLKDEYLAQREYVDTVEDFVNFVIQKTK